MTNDLRIGIKEEDIPRELYRLSDAYLDAAENLNAQIVNGGWESSYQRGQVVLFLTFHAIELCLKGCIKTLLPSATPWGQHKLPKLAQELNALLPDLDYRVPFGAVPTPPPEPGLRARMEAHDRELHQQLRYPADNDGKPWEGVFVFSATLFAGSLREIRDELVRIRAHVGRRSNGPTPASSWPTAMI